MLKACCAFTGYRPHRLPYGNDESHPDCIRLKYSLMEAVNSHLDMGIRIFISGMARGIDQWAAEIVLMAKENHPHDGIELWCAIPYDRQAAAWTQKEQARYHTILSKADHIDYVSHQYYDGCLLARNRFMIDHAMYLIAVYDGQKGGTRYTVNYAKRKGIYVTIVDPYAHKDNATVQNRGP